MIEGAKAAATAVVIGLDNFTGLQSARILAARGIPVVGIAADTAHYCARTRVPRQIIRSATAGEPLVEALERLGRRLAAPAFLLPCTDLSVLTVSQYRADLEQHYRFVLPEHGVLVTLMEKASFAQHALDHALPVPPTAVLRTRNDAARAAAELAFPAVVKPSLKGPEWFANTQAKALLVRGPADLLEVYDRVAGWTDALIAQSWVEGSEASLYTSNAYFGRDGSPLAMFVSRKIRQWPIETGQGSLAVEARNDAVVEATLRLYGSVDYRGLGYAEVKRERRTGSYFIIEPNVGRPTGRSAIAERGGVELLLTAYCDALGLPLPVEREQRYGGVKWIYWRRDLQSAAVRMLRRELTPRQWLRSVRGPSVEAVASLRDPLPMIAELGYAAGALARSLARSVARRLRRGQNRH